MRNVVLAAVLLVAILGFVEATQDTTGVQPDTTMAGSLIPAHSTMVRAWDLPQNPLTDPLPEDKHLAEQIKYGFELFTRTPELAPDLCGNAMTCAHCHLNAGQREKALPLVGIAGSFPEYNRRAGRLFSLEDRIVGCFARSMNSTGVKNKTSPGRLGEEGIPRTRKEVLAISAYIAWLSSGYGMGEKLSWRNQNVIPQDKLIPVHQLDRNLGKQLYMEKCTSCHGEDGQGLPIGDKKAGPLWGKGSWNDGAGAARVYTLAGMIRHMMPYLAPGSLTDEEAQHIAAFITSQPRPKYPFKATDYQTEKIPPDAVYYRR